MGSQPPKLKSTRLWINEETAVDVPVTDALDPQDSAKSRKIHERPPPPTLKEGEVVKDECPSLPLELDEDFIKRP
jgi:hypothetical protein